MEASCRLGDRLAAGRYLNQQSLVLRGLWSERLIEPTVADVQ